MTPSPRPRRVLFAADTLLDADDSAASGYVCPVPCQRLDGGRIRVWPRPKVRTNTEGRPVTLALDLTAWFVTYDSGESSAGITFPLVAHHQQAAQAAAETFAAHVAEGSADPKDPAYIAEWSKWWCDQTADAHLTDARRFT